MSSYTPGNYCFLEEDIDIIDNGTSSEEDDEGSSSEDEIRTILQGRSHLVRKPQSGFSGRHGKKPRYDKEEKEPEDASFQDEFETDMNTELNRTVHVLENFRSQGVNPSDVSNDDLMYDPEMDDADQRWVDRQRRRNLKPGAKGRQKEKLPTSDAVLNCPACMTTLCLDCQRHEFYKTQYRAMFVMNCQVDLNETLSYPESKKAKKKSKKKQEMDAGKELAVQSAQSTESAQPSLHTPQDAAATQAMQSTHSTQSSHPSQQSSQSAQPTQSCEKQEAGNSNDLFHPVRCTECNTVVGVIDKEEIYHFFNVLASYT